MNQLDTKPKFKKYPAYKDSGVEWLGEIPEHWEVKKFKHILQEKKKVSNPLLNCGAISFGKVVYKDDDKLPETTKASYQEVLAGEFLINPLNLNYDLISLRIALSEINVVVSSGYIVLKNIIHIDKKYFSYLLHRYDVSYMKLFGSGVRQTISFNNIAFSILALPPLQEQTAIATFLENKTAKIDHAIAQKEKMIALLKERKQIIIQDLVTGKKVWNDALNTWTEPTELKDSGVEWIGGIPAHWEVKRLKYVVKIYNGQDYKHVMSEQGYPVIGSGGHFAFSNEYMFDGEVLLLGRKGTIDKPQYFNGKFWTVDTMFYSVAKKGFYTKYLYFVATTIPFKFYSTSTALPSMTQADLNNNPIAIPSFEEQNKIAFFIEEQSAKIDKAITLQEQQIEKLKELKSTLIDSAVTGKIKV